MPYVKIEMLRGRTKEQKKAVAAAVTAALVDHAKAKAAQVSIVFQDVDADDWAEDGKLLSEK